MTTEKGLATINTDDTLAVSAYEKPSLVIARATEWANALMDVVEKKKLYATINSKKHLEAEAWELILAFDHAGPRVDWVSPMEDGEGMVIGYLAQVSIIKGDTLKASAIMPCGFDDFPCRGKTGTAQVKAAMSAAQTWAMCKACRLCYSPVAVLAGYAPTPAEEMPPPIVADNSARTQPKAPTTRERAGFCPLHPTVKQGLFQGRACHKLPDETFCYGVAPEEPQVLDDPPEETSPPDIGPYPDTPLGQLQKEVNEQEMQWSEFEKTVLHMPWAEWVKLGGNIQTARVRWANYEKQEEAA